MESGNQPSDPENQVPARKPDGTFAKGVSGNPGGKPKGPTTLALVRQLLEVNPKRRQRIAEKVLAMCEGGDFQVIKELFNREDGPVETRLANADGSNLSINIVPVMPADWFAPQLSESENGQPSNSRPASLPALVDESGPVDPQAG